MKLITEKKTNLKEIIILTKKKEKEKKQLICNCLSRLIQLS